MFVLALLFASGTLTTAPATAAAAATPADPVICTKRSEMETGTRMRPHRLCLKKSDWDYYERQTKIELQMYQDRKASTPGGGRPH